MNSLYKFSHKLTNSKVHDTLMEALNELDKSKQNVQDVFDLVECIIDSPTRRINRSLRDSVVSTSIESALEELHYSLEKLDQCEASLNCEINMIEMQCKAQLNLAI